MQVKNLAMVGLCGILMLATTSNAIAANKCRSQQAALKTAQKKFNTADKASTKAQKLLDAAQRLADKLQDKLDNEGSKCADSIQNEQIKCDQKVDAKKAKRDEYQARLIQYGVELATCLAQVGLGGIIGEITGENGSTKQCKQITKARDTMAYKITRVEKEIDRTRSVCQHNVAKKTTTCNAKKSKAQLALNRQLARIPALAAKLASAQGTAATAEGQLNAADAAYQACLNQPS